MSRFYVKDFGDEAVCIVERWGIGTGEDRIVCDFRHWHREDLARLAWEDAESMCALMNEASCVFPADAARRSSL